MCLGERRTLAWLAKTPLVPLFKTPCVFGQTVTTEPKTARSTFNNDLLCTYCVPGTAVHMCAQYSLALPSSLSGDDGGQEGAPQKTDFIFHQSWRWDTQLILGGKKRTKRMWCFLYPPGCLGFSNERQENLLEK